MNPQTVNRFFLFTIGMLVIFTFIYLTLQGEKFTADQYQNYRGTWLCHNQLLIDNGDNTMKFNFPGLGETLVQLLRAFVPLIPHVQELALTK